MKLSFTLCTRGCLLLVALFFSFTLFAQAPSNNECSGAADINALFGQPTGMTMSSGLFDNTNATSEPSDPTTGFDCFGEPNYSTTVPQVENSLWFTFTGDGNTYFIETDDCGSSNYLDGGDTQIAIYLGPAGQCSSTLTPVACSEDGPNAAQNDFKAGLTLDTQADSVYYMLIDGFNFQGSLSSGEFCVQVTQELVTTCNDIYAGDVTAAKQIVCFNDTTEFTIENTVLPNAVGDITGFRWIITGADVSGAANPGADPSYAGAFVGSTSPYTPTLTNDGSSLPTNTFVYFTPVAYAGAVDTVGDGFFGSLDFSNGCLATGNSVLVLLAGDNGEITATPYSQATTVASPPNGAAGVDITGGGSLIYGVEWNTGEITDTITGLDPGDYTVTISDVGECVNPLVLTVTVADSIPLNTSSPEFEAALKLFPNPAKEQTQLFYNFSETTDLNLRLTGLNGQLLREEQVRGVQSGRFDLPVSDLPSGVYLLQIRDDQNLVTKRLFIE